MKMRRLSEVLNETTVLSGGVREVSFPATVIATYVKTGLDKLSAASMLLYRPGVSSQVWYVPHNYVQAGWLCRLSKKAPSRKNLIKWFRMRIEKSVRIETHKEWIDNLIKAAERDLILGENHLVVLVQTTSEDYQCAYMDGLRDEAVAILPVYVQSGELTLTFRMPVLADWFVVPPQPYATLEDSHTDE